jgi:hypothetical protein
MKGLDMSTTQRALEQEKDSLLCECRDLRKALEDRDRTVTTLTAIIAHQTKIIQEQQKAINDMQPTSRHEWIGEAE